MATGSHCARRGYGRSIHHNYDTSGAYLGSVGESSFLKSIGIASIKLAARDEEKPLDAFGTFSLLDRIEDALGDGDVASLRRENADLKEQMRGVSKQLAAMAGPKVGA